MTTKLDSKNKLKKTLNAYTRDGEAKLDLGQNQKLNVPLKDLNIKDNKNSMLT